MAMEKIYSRVNWQNEPSEATALNDVNLNKMDSAINTLDDRIVTLSTEDDSLDYRLDLVEDGKVDKVTGKGLSQVDNISVTSQTNNGDEIALVQINRVGGTEGVYIKNGVVVDDALSSSSENPVQNKVVKSAIDAKSTVTISDTLATGTTLANITIDGTTTAIKGSDIEVDEELSPTSENPVENKAIYDALNNLLPSKTVSGNPISISDASGFNAKALTVSMNPIQDLHGYSNPWAGGAGKNKIKLAITTQTISDVDLTVYDDGTFDANGTASADISLVLVRKSNNPISIPEGTLTLSGCPSGGSSSGYGLSVWKTGAGSSFDTGSGASFNYASTQDWAVSLVISSGTQCNHKIFKPMICLSSASEPTTFAPYSNICPISGRTEASMVRTGKNILYKTIDGVTIGTNGAISANSSYNIVIAQVLQGMTYTFSLNGVASVAVRSFFTAEPASGSSSYNGERYTTDNTFVSPINGYVAIRTSTNATNIQLENGSQATEYTPYAGAETYTHQYSETIYGGVDDFVNGELQNELRIISENDFTSVSSGTTPNGYHWADINIGYTPTVNMSNMLPNKNGDSGWGSSVPCFGYVASGTYKYMRVYCKESTLADFKTAYAGLQIVFSREAPTTISTSAEEITLLKGNNVLSTNADDMELKYSVSLDSLLTT